MITLSNHNGSGPFKSFLATYTLIGLLLSKIILFHTKAFNLIPGVSLSSGFVNFIKTG